ncbi:MAG TPA: hypothetical protein VN968_07245, partial [Bradyrhizobium sp.]|nr:hypothetical protein [Bradyrhizobium sp.]
AVYGPVCTVVWEGWSREAPPYPDHWRFSDAGRRSAWIASSRRHPKTCTQAEVKRHAITSTTLTDIVQSVRMKSWITAMARSGASPSLPGSTPLVMTQPSSNC